MLDRQEDKSENAIFVYDLYEDVKKGNRQATIVKKMNELYFSNILSLKRFPNLQISSFEVILLWLRAPPR